MVAVATEAAGALGEVVHMEVCCQRMNVRALSYTHRDALGQLRTGPPLFLVVRNLNLSDAAPDLRRVCGISGCDPHSLVNRLAAAAAAPAETSIAAPPASWLDDFMAWLNPGLPQCCREHHELGEALVTALAKERGELRGAGRLAQGSRSGGGGGGGSTQLAAASVMHSPVSPLQVTHVWTGAPQRDIKDGYCPPPDQAPCSTNATACSDCATCVSSPFQGAHPP